MKTKSTKPWLASIESPVGATQVVRLWETSVGPTASSHFQHLIGRAGQSSSDFLAHAHQAPFRIANPNFPLPIARPMRKKAVHARSPIPRLKGEGEDDLRDLVLDTRHGARPPYTVRSHLENALHSARQDTLQRVASSSEAQMRGELLLDLRDHISMRTFVPYSLVPASQSQRTLRLHTARPELRNPAVAQFLNRFDHKPVAKVAKMSRRGFQGRKLVQRTLVSRTGKKTRTDTQSSEDDQETYVEYFTLKSEL